MKTIICDIIKKHGKEILLNEQSFMDLLNDYYPYSSEEKDVIKKLVHDRKLKDFYFIDSENDDANRLHMLSKLNLELKKEYGMEKRWIIIANDIFVQVFGWNIQAVKAENREKILQILSEAMKCASQNDFEGAEDLLIPLVEKGNLFAMAKLAELYLYGAKCRFNKEYEEKALQLFMKSAEGGCTESYCQLSVLYRIGRYGVEQSDVTAFEYLQRAYESGDVKVATMLAMSYMNGIGVVKNITKAVELAKIAADNMEKHAMTMLADCYQNGVGVEMSTEKSAYWREKADLTVPNRWLDGIRYMQKQLEIIGE